MTCKVCSRLGLKPRQGLYRLSFAFALPPSGQPAHWLKRIEGLGLAHISTVIEPVCWGCRHWARTGRTLPETRR